MRIEIKHDTYRSQQRLIDDGEGPQYAKVELVTIVVDDCPMEVRCRADAQGRVCEIEFDPKREV